MPNVLSSYDWIEALSEVPATIDDRLDILQSAYDVSDLTFSLAMTADVRRLFFAEADSVGTVASYGSTLVVNSGYTFVEDAVIYIGDETLRIDSVTASGPSQWSLGVTRGFAGSPLKTLAAGDAVYVLPPYHRPRPVTMYIVNQETGEQEPPWRGLLDDIKTNDGQTEARVAAISPHASLKSAMGMIAMPNFKISGEDLEWSAGGTLRGSIKGAQNNGFADVEWVNPNAPVKAMMIGDAAATFTLQDGDLVSLAGVTIQRASTSGPVESGETVRELFVAIRGVTSSASGVYGNAYNLPAILLALMLSTGTGQNNPIVGPDTLDFDILGARVGLGIPWTLFDIPSWKTIIDEGADFVTNMALGVDGPWDFGATVIQGLRQSGLYMARNAAGLLALYRLSTWTLEDMRYLMAQGHHALLSPGAELDRRLKSRVPAVSAFVGRTPWDDDPDPIRVKVLQGDRRDTATLAQTGEVYEMPYFRKSQEVGGGYADRDRQRVMDFLQLQAVLRRDCPPHIKCSMPERHAVLLGGTAGRVPGVGEWIRLRRAPYDVPELTGPDGELVDPNTTSILFIGRLVQRTLDLRTGDVNGVVELYNWRSGDVSPRIVAPEARIISTSFGGAVNFVVSGTDFASRFGTTGFSAGDEVVVLDVNGDPDVRDDGNLTVVSITPGINPTVVCSGTLSALVGDEGARLALADPDRYDNDSWDGASYFEASFAYRQFAYLADAEGRVGTIRDDRADYYN